ncbi:MAG: 6-phosphofructokinase [Chloroflexi bacterium]|nr:6-phosphofructokinase [Chloroflexota bacterium]
MKRIGVLTSGGDAPGMNACVRAVVRTALSAGLEVYGIRRGYSGLIDGDMEPLTARDVGGIIQRGGTFLQTARSAEFMTVDGRKQAVRRLNDRRIDGLVIIGGNGSLAGAYELHKMGVPVVGVPGSIDNDVPFTDMSIGVDTALNTMVHIIDMIKDTASSHQRCFLVQVMGRHHGYLALIGGIIAGAEVTIIPEKEIPLEEIARAVDDAYVRGKTHAIIVVAEGAKFGAREIADYLCKVTPGFEVRVTVLGHVQRGGSPSAFDRLLATRMGMRAVQAMLAGEFGTMTALRGNRIELVPLEQVVQGTPSLNLGDYDVAQMLAR